MNFRALALSSLIAMGITHAFAPAASFLSKADVRKIALHMSAEEVAGEQVLNKYSR